MSYHNIPLQSRTNAQGEAAPSGFHYMPDGTLMSDIEHGNLYGEKKITAFDGIDALYVLAKYRYFN